MSRSTIWKLVVLAGVVLGLPALSGLGAYVLLRQDIVKKYNVCVSKLTEAQRRVPGAVSIIDDLKQVDSFEGKRWALNSPYEAGAINILIPAMADDAWSEQCGLNATRPDCLAAPNEQFIICNPAIGRIFINPRLTLDIINPEVQRPLRFMAATLLGHELGHLRAASEGAVRHLFPDDRANGLRCTRFNRARPSEEEVADIFGLKAACDAMKVDRSDVVGSDVRSAINTITQLRERLDESFEFDDTCGGDDTYPSFSRRKSTFGREFAKCLFPKGDLPYPAVASDQDSAFQHLEAWLRERQISGFLGSATNGGGPVYRFDVAGTASRTHFLAIDSAGRSAQVSSTTKDGTAVRHSVLATWDRAADVVDVRSKAAGAVSEFLISLAGPEDTTDLRFVTVTCATAEAACKADQRQKMLPSGVEVSSTAGHSIIERSGSTLKTFASAADYLNGKVSTTWKTSEPREKIPLLSGSADRLVLSWQPGESETPSGVHRLAFNINGRSIETTFVTAPTNMNPLHAIGLYGSHLAFVLQPSSRQIGGQAQLWVCPSTPFEAITARDTSTTCDVYDPPKDMSYSIGIANNDLSSLGTRLTEAEECTGFIIIRQGGWLWLVDPTTRKQDIMPGTGIVNCSSDRTQALVYRMRRLDEITMKMENAMISRQSLTIIRTKAMRP